MTEPRPQAKRQRKPSASLVFWASVLLFAALFALLTYRFEAESQAVEPTAQAVQVRKVIKRRVVTTIVGGSGGSTVSTGPVSSSTSSAPAAESEPVVTSAS
jgi:hypothetical protein